MNLIGMKVVQRLKGQRSLGAGVADWQIELHAELGHHLVEIITADPVHAAGSDVGGVARFAPVVSAAEIGEDADAKWRIRLWSFERLTCVRGRPEGELVGH